MTGRLIIRLVATTYMFLVTITEIRNVHANFADARTSGNDAAWLFATTAWLFMLACTLGAIWGI